MIRVTQAFDVAVAFCAFGTEVVQGFFGVVGVTGYGGFDFFVDHDIDLDSLLGFALEDLVEAVFLVEVRWTAEEEFGREPPVGDVDCLLCILEDL